MTSHRTTKPHSAGTTPTDIITYRYNGEMVYVPVAPGYVQALSHARDAFPQLKSLCDASISLTMSMTTPGPQRCVGISAPAWPKLITHMARYQIIDVQVTPSHERAGPIPDITITYANAEGGGETDPAPPYRGPGVVDDEKASYPRPPSPSTTLHPKRSWLFQKLHRQ